MCKISTKILSVIRIQILMDIRCCPQLNVSSPVAKILLSNFRQESFTERKSIKKTFHIRICDSSILFLITVSIHESIKFTTCITRLTKNVCYSNYIIEIAKRKRDLSPRFLIYFWGHSWFTHSFSVD